MRALHFAVAYRTRGTKQAPAQAHVRYITRAQVGAAEHVGYVTRTTQPTREDLVATGYGNLPAWAQDDPATFFAAADTFERVNGRTATQITAMLPRALGRAELVATVEAFVQSQLGTAHAHVWGIHETMASDGGRYPHVHIAFSERKDTGMAHTPREYFSQQVNPKERTFSARDWPFAARQAWSDTLNAALEAAWSADRVSARSFRDQGMDWQTAGYIDRQTLQRDKALLRQRTRVEDTSEAVAKRTQEWEARKHELGITHGMERQAIVQRIGDHSREHLRRERVERNILTRGVTGMSETELHEYLQRKEAQLDTARTLRRAEQHYVAHPEQVRSVNHLAAVAKLAQSTQGDDDAGQVLRRKRTHQDDEQERGRTHAREW
jgi:hypothetical protein